MCKAIFFTALVFIFMNVHGQQTAPAKPAPQLHYLQKSKKQKNAAWILLGGGTALMITGLVIPKGEMTKDGFCISWICDREYKNDDLKAGLFLTGVISSLGSIPFFIMSGKNRKRAAALSLKIEHKPQLFYQSLAYTAFPALKVKVNL